MKLHRRVAGKIKTVTVQRDVDRWYVCFSVAREAATMPAVFTEIGVDVGLDSFVTLAHGTAIDNPRHLAKGLARLRRAQRRLSRVSGSATGAGKQPCWWPRPTARSATSEPLATTM